MEITLEITNYCEYGCLFCPADAVDKEDKDRNIYYLTTSYIKEVLDELNGFYNITRINISGGEPLAHNEFYDILTLCKKYTSNIWVYTNALTQIVYNTGAIKEIKIEAEVYLMTGQSAYIPMCADVINVRHVDRSKFVNITNDVAGDDDRFCLKAHGELVKIE